MTLSTSAFAITASYEGFDYTTGALNGRNGGTGDWKDPWSGDSGIRVVSPGFTETDGSGNELTVSGNRIGKTGTSVLKSVRTLNTETGNSTETVWASVIIDGDSGNRIHNFSLGDGLFIGQGTKDSTTNRIGMSDQDGLLQNSTITPNAQHFLVLRVDFRSGAEHAWLWIDPALDSEPSTASADASSTNVKEFKFSFVQIQVQRPNNTGIDEIRLGPSFADVTPHTASAVCGNGIVESPEQCDDGGTSSGDGCDASCQVETDWTCSGEPSTCTEINTSPVAVADNGGTVAEGGTLSGQPNVLTNDTDAESSPLTATLVTDVANGTLALNSDGSFTYTHDGSETTEDTFTYKASDGALDSNTVTVTITIGAANNAPEILLTSLPVAQAGASYSSSWLVTDADLEDVLSMSIQGAPSWLIGPIFRVEDGYWYLAGIPATDDEGTTVITLSAQDNASPPGTVELQLSLTVLPATPAVPAIPPLGYVLLAAGMALLGIRQSRN